MPVKFKPKPLSEQTIVITGATSGIGLATARMAALKGANVALASKNENALDQIVEELTKQGGKVIGVPTDVAVLADLKNLCTRTVEELGPIDTWINNAGTSIYGYLMDSSLEEERKLFELNFWGTRMGSLVAIHEMKDCGGVLINLGSEVAVAAQPLLGIYSASKYAIKAFTEALRSELRDREIQVEVCLIRPTAMDITNEGQETLSSPPETCDFVAEAILKCAEDPQRDVYVGGPARLSAIIETFFPQVKDLMAESRMKELKQSLAVSETDENETKSQNSTLSVMKTLKDNLKSSLREFRKEDGH